MTADHEPLGAETAGSETAGSETAGAEAAGAEAAGAEAAGTETAGTETAGTSAAGAGVTVRLLTAADWAAMRAARLAALAEAPYAFASTLAREQEFSEETWRSRAGSGRAFGAWRGGELVGLATGLPPEPDRPEWELVGMWVAPDVRGSGAADGLVEAVCELARQSGADTVTLWVTEVNGRARRFYRRLGFAPTGRRQVVRPGEPDRWEEELARRLR